MRRSEGDDTRKRESGSLSIGHDVELQSTARSWGARCTSPALVISRWRPFAILSPDKTDGSIAFLPPPPPPRTDPHASTRRAFVFGQTSNWITAHTDCEGCRPCLLARHSCSSHPHTRSSTHNHQQQTSQLVILGALSAANEYQQGGSTFRQASLLAVHARIVQESLLAEGAIYCRRRIIFVSLKSSTTTTKTTTRTRAPSTAINHCPEQRAALASSLRFIIS